MKPVAGPAASTRFRRFVHCSAWVVTLATTFFCSASANALEAAQPSNKAAGLVIQSPKVGENVRDNSGVITVVLAVEDSATLPDGMLFRLLLNGKPAAPDGVSKSIELTDVHRGTYELQALIVNGDGQVLTWSAPVRFTMRQASRLNPAP